MKLLEPVTIGRMRLRNRIVMPAIGTRLASEFGGVTDAIKAYYATRARGGAGLLITGASWLDRPGGKFDEIRLRSDEDRYIAGLADLAQAVQSEGSHLALQIGHTGRNGNGPDLISASDVPHPFSGVVPKPLTKDGIRQIIEEFAEAARRAKQAGMSAIELHGAHGYLIDQFLSPYSNKRTDEYGGSTENRARFALEVIQAVRAKVGPDFPIIFRIDGDEFVEGGLRLEESAFLARMLEKAGIDALNVSGGIYETFPMMIQPMAIPKASLVHLAEGIHNKVHIPVIAAGSLIDPIADEQILQDGKADLIAIGRQLITDPDFPSKVARGEFNEIRPCIRCNQCLHRVFQGQRIRCAVNAFAGRELELKVTPAVKAKRAVVIGGGPAGMEAARVMALRGHRVTLYERGQALGGQVLTAASPPHKEELLGYLKWLEGQLKKSGVAVKLNTEVTPQKAGGLKADAVVVATGPSPCVPQFPVSPEVKAKLARAEEILSGTIEAGQNIIIVGGGTVGSETAEHLAEKDKRVTIIEMLDDIALDMEFLTRTLLLSRLKEKGVNVFTGTTVQEVTAKGVIVTDKGGGKQELPADTVVLCTGSQPNRELLDELSARMTEVYGVGDCIMPRKIIDAVADGTCIGLKI